MAARIVATLRKWLSGDEREKARHWHAVSERARSAEAHARREEFMRRMAASGRGGKVLLGRGRASDGRFQWCGMTPEELCAMHIGISGATGTGKSYMIASLLFQLLMRRVTLIVIDMKSELAKLLLEVIVPAVVARGREDL